MSYQLLIQKKKLHINSLYPVDLFQKSEQHRDQVHNVISCMLFVRAPIVLTRRIEVRCYHA